MKFQKSFIRQLRKQLRLRAAQMQAQQNPQAPGGAPADVSGEIAGPLEARDKPEIPNTGGGFGALQRKIIEQGNTEGMV